jgi:hypothetical protein
MRARGPRPARGAGRRGRSSRAAPRRSCRAARLAARQPRSGAVPPSRSPRTGAIPVANVASSPGASSPHYLPKRASERCYAQRLRVELATPSPPAVLLPSPSLAMDGPRLRQLSSRHPHLECRPSPCASANAPCHRRSSSESLLSGQCAGACYLPLRRELFVHTDPQCGRSLRADAAGGGRAVGKPIRDRSAPHRSGRGRSGGPAR